jgi:DNA repair exonuclease SbcCD ATPase subunit
MELQNMDVENYEVDKEIKSKFPNADTSQFMSKIDEYGIVYVKSLRKNARNWYPLYANEKLNPKLPNSIVNALEGGLSTRLDKAEEELTEKNTLLEEKEEEYNNIQKGLKSLGEQLRQERLNSLSKEKGQLLQEIKELQTNVQNIRQELLVKEEQLRQNQQAIEDYEQQIELQREIINDSNRTVEEREAAQQEVNRLQERIDELNTEKEQIETELGLTLREKIKRIFKKYGFTVVSVAIAVSTVIGVIISQLKNGLSSVAKGVGNGLKTLEKKLGQILPGMIGAIASFIFKTAGEVVSFVAEHAWLLIVAVVVFVVEKFKK